MRRCYTFAAVLVAAVLALAAPAGGRITSGNDPNYVPPAGPNPNLLNCSNEVDTATWWTTGGLTVGAGAGPVQVIFPSGAALQQPSENSNTALLPSTQYTLSWVASFVSGTATIRAMYRDISGVTPSSNIAVDGARHSATFTTPSTIQAGGGFGFTTDAAGDAVTLNLSQVKLEQAASPTTYGADVACPTINANLLGSPTIFNVSPWSNVGAPNYGTNITGPDGQTDAQQVTFNDPRSGPIQGVTLNAGTTYTFSIYDKLVSGTPAYYVCLYDGAHACGTSQSPYSSKITPTSIESRRSFTVTPSVAIVDVVIVNANVDGASQGNTGVATLWGAKLEAAAAPTAFPQSAAAGRSWAFIVNPGGDQFRWAGENSGWASKPMDGLHTQTDLGDCGWFGDSVTWTTGGAPAPTRFMMSFQYTTPGQNWIDMSAAATGSYDAAWLACLNAHTGSHVSVVRIWQEINGSFMPWSVNQTGGTHGGVANGSPWTVAQIQGGLQHAATQVRTAFPNALIEFNCNFGTFAGGPGDHTCFDLYPGDAYVNIVGVDAYEKDASFATIKSGAGVNLDKLITFATAHNKKINWSETASHSCDGTFLTSIMSWFDGLGTQGAVFSYYDQGLANNGDNVIFPGTGTDQCGNAGSNALESALNAGSFGQKSFTGSLPCLRRRGPRGRTAAPSAAARSARPRPCRARQTNQSPRDRALRR